MTAVQFGANNQLTWTQEGLYLPDLSVTQSGSQAVSIQQSRDR